MQEQSRENCEHIKVNLLIVYAQEINNLYSHNTVD